jgi:hypothetical protein
MNAGCLHTIQTGIAVTLILALTACTSHPPTILPSPSAAVSATETPIVPTPTVTSTAEAHATATQEAATAGPPTVETGQYFQGFQFRLPPALGAEARSRQTPFSEILGEQYPPYLEITLAGYAAQNTNFEPQILVYPVWLLRENPTQIVQTLKDLLRDHPPSLRGSLPLLPPVPAGQLLHAQVRYLTFEGGSGVRLLTQFAQDASPIHNEGLLYIFQGLTSDDAYYISAFLPVSASFLPDQADDPEDLPFPAYNSPNFDAEYTSYQQAIKARLEAASPEEFLPSLSALDQLIESFQTEGMLDVQESETSVCVNAWPERLHVNGFAYLDPDPPIPNNLRREAGKANDLIGEIQPGETMKILEGPQCADGWVWWKVRTFGSELTGWTAEGNLEEYWLVPCPSRKECGP